MNFRKKAVLIATFAIVVVCTAFPVSADSIDSITSSSTDIEVGRANLGPYGVFWGYRPTASHNICTVTLPLKAVGTPTDSVFLRIYSGTTTYPSFGSDFLLGLTFLKEADSQWQIRSSTYANTTFTFSPCVTVAGANWYAFNFYRSGSATNTNYYDIQGRDGGGVQAKTGLAQWATDRLLSNSTFHANAYPTFIPSITLNGTENYGVSSIPTPGFAQSIINDLAGVTSDATGLAATASSTSAFGSILSFYAHRVPWGYIFDIRDAYTNAATTSDEFGAIHFDFSDTRISTSTRAWLPGDLVVFSTTTVTTYLSTTALGGINTLCGSIIWLLGIAYWYRRATST